MDKNALITGVTGQDGSLLAKYLLDLGYYVIGMERRTSSPTNWRLRELGIINHPRFKVASGDLTDQSSIERIFMATRFDEIYNLAAQSFVGVSWNIAESTIDITGMGAVRIFEAARIHCPEARIYQASSSEMFGGERRELILDEGSEMHPRSPYGAAKCLAHQMANIYRESYGMFISCGILFNHESEFRGLQFVTRKITNAVAEIVLGSRKTLELMTLDSKRDWGYAPDFVKGMQQMLQQPKPSDFILATGRVASIGDFVEMAFNAAGINPITIPKHIKISENERPNELRYLKGDAAKARGILHWQQIGRASCRERV